MFELDWGVRKRWDLEPAPGVAADSALPRDNVARTMLLNWEEHCLECAATQCYTSCSLFVKRADRKCARLVYGIIPDKHFKGLFDYGADSRFRRWGKLETRLFGASIKVWHHVWLNRFNRALTPFVYVATRIMRPFFPKRNLEDLWFQIRNRLLLKLPRRLPPSGYDQFVIECFSPDPVSFRLILDYRPDAISVFRHAFEIRPGHNFHALSADKIRPRKGATNNLLTLYPENDQERRLIFTWLDFVKYREGAGPKSNGQAKTNIATSAIVDNAPIAQAVDRTAAPAKHVKCVAWDLDNTLWRGTLVESSPDQLAPLPEAVAMIKALDERGILQTIVSKNNHDQAWAVLSRHDLQDYFLYPAINWGPKSVNLQQVADRLNINIDTLALIDDSPFERGEVQSALPMVRTYPETDIPQLLNRPEFDVPITEMSRVRRLSYRVEIQRERAQETFVGEDLDFLRSCGFVMRLFVPRTPDHIKRCLELVQRSNQLNLSSRRYTAIEFETLLQTPGVFSVAMHCKDRFGEYGIVGFCSVDERENPPLVSDLVLSCRVAQKRVEHALCRWLSQRAKAHGRRSLRARLVVTARNGPLLRVFEELPFQRINNDGENVLMELEIARLPADEGVVRIVDEASLPAA